MIILIVKYAIYDICHEAHNLQGFSVHKPNVEASCDTWPPRLARLFITGSAGDAIIFVVALKGGSNSASSHRDTKHTVVLIYNKYVSTFHCCFCFQHQQQYMRARRVISSRRVRVGKPLGIAVSVGVGLIRTVV